MSAIDITIDQSHLSDAYSKLRSIPGAFPRAVAAAANRTIERASTEIVRSTKERYFVTAGDVRKSLTLRKASASNTMGVIVSRGRHKNLADYKLTPKSPAVGRKKGFKGAVKREGGLKPLPQGTFMIDTPNAGPVLFIRTRPNVRRNDWGAIKHVHSPSIPQIVKNKETVEAVEKTTHDEFLKRLDHEVLRLLGALP